MQPRNDFKPGTKTHRGVTKPTPIRDKSIPGWTLPCSAFRYRTAHDPTTDHFRGAIHSNLSSSRKYRDGPISPDPLHPRYAIPRLFRRSTIVAESSAPSTFSGA